jgi:outer membrane protein
MKKLLLIAVSLLLLSNAFAQQQSEYSFSLQQAVDYAKQNNGTIKNARLDEELYKRKVQEFTGLGYPQISASGTGQYFFDIPTAYFPNFIEPSIYGVLYQNQLIDSLPQFSDAKMPVQFGSKYSLSGSVDASQLVFDGQFFVGLQAQRAVLDLAKKNTQRTETDIQSEVSKAYYNVLIMDKRLELLNTNVERLGKLRNDTKALYDNGFVEKLDVDRITVTYNNLVVERDKIMKLSELTSMALKLQMGMDVNSKLNLTDSLQDDNFESLLQSSFDAQNRTEYQLLLAQKSLYNLQRKQHTMAYLPGLYAFGSYGYSAQSDTFNFFKKPETAVVNGQEITIKRWYPTALVGLKLQVPIFDGFQKARRIQQAKIEMQKTQNNLDNLKNAINLEANSAKINLTNTTMTLQSQKENMELAENVYKTSKIKYDEGVGSSLELVNAQAELKTAQTNYLGALYDAYIARIDYLKATGQLK